ncbi:LuxR family transcriptional regulator [Chryseobacterium nematophagum]|uniref:LuxR family transcriptional regulator n=1 Tax=Chryseobacterium nematophagum TaxID=2305228 RepID=A0A3M7TI08_9FLAO|nr:helix-turn-helix transcriptional regulator [Chryseobacterium nematophagum]RNA63202.1 LuxR family transcriptional regulator [Chryseobacterium nematophagum]
MNNKKVHPLIKVWNDYPELLQNTSDILPLPPIERIVGEVFAPGESYYYVINFADSTIGNHHPNILKMHGLKAYPNHLKDIIDLIHPADIPFVMEAERMCIEKIKEIGFAYQQELKSSYCFRMKTGKGNYEMFYHQALHIHQDELGRLMQAVNIHSNIQHITQNNSYVALISGIGDRNDFHQMSYKSVEEIEISTVKLTDRELEVLSLLARGYSAKEIADQLIISYHTVTTHRKNILKKLECNKVSELIKKALDYGLI